MSTAIRTVALAHQLEQLERMPVGEIIAEAPAEIGDLMRRTLALVAEWRLTNAAIEREREVMA